MILVNIPEHSRGSAAAQCRDLRKVSPGRRKSGMSECRRWLFLAAFATLSCGYSDFIGGWILHNLGCRCAMPSWLPAHKAKLPHNSVGLKRLAFL